jgi:hypothetical protein
VCESTHPLIPKGGLYADQRSDALTFEARTIFLRAFPAEAKLSHHFRVSREQAEMHWDSIVASLSSLEDPCVRTFFCGLGLGLDTRQLLALTSISSLAALALIPAQRTRRSWESDGVAEYGPVRNWCRAAGEKNALPHLRVLYLGAASMDIAQDVVLLDYLSALPALALVGLERTSFFFTGVRTHGQWEWATQDSDRYTQLLQGYDEAEHSSVAERVLTLYNIADGKGSLATGTETKHIVSLERLLRDKHKKQVRLSMTCFSVVSGRFDGDIVWYRRRSFSPPFSSKRPQEGQTTTTTDEGQKGTKKRKIRQNKQQDIGSLLGEFT